MVLHNRATKYGATKQQPIVAKCTYAIFMKDWVIFNFSYYRKTCFLLVLISKTVPLISQIIYNHLRFFFPDFKEKAFHLIYGDAKNE